MPFINLIQEQRSGIRQQERRARAFFFAFGTVTCLSVLSFGFLLLQTEQSQSEINRLQREFQKLEPVVKQTEANDAELRDLAPKLTTLENAQAATERWGRILDHLSRNIPQGMWLTNLRCVAIDPTKPIQLTMTGLTSSQDSVGDLILRLQSCKDLQNVLLKFTQEKMVENSKAVEFEVGADIVGTEEKKALSEAREEKDPA